jgi:NAD(P)-dependent dehydrogenase (short-subunit alcohol dehydrogenase family)
MSATDTEGKPVVVVTGASRGIGLGVACLLAANDVPMLLTARGAERLEKAAEALRSKGGRVETHACDAADENAMTEAFRRAAQMGPIGAVLNNAGVLEPISPILEVDVARFEAHLRTNVTGVLVGTKLALTYRESKHSLRIVNVSSGAASHGYRSWAAYCASKAAVNLLTEVAAAETGGDTSVVAVAPGIIETQMQRTIRATSEDRFPDVAKFQQLKDDGALLHPTVAAIALVWLLLDAPLQLSGKFVDARDADVQRQITAPGSGVVERAKTWFDQLETQD